MNPYRWCRMSENEKRRSFHVKHASQRHRRSRTRRPSMFDDALLIREVWLFKVRIHLSSAWRQASCNNLLQIQPQWAAQVRTIRSSFHVHRKMCLAGAPTSHRKFVTNKATPTIPPVLSATRLFHVKRAGEPRRVRAAGGSRFSMPCQLIRCLMATGLAVVGCPPMLEAY